MEFLNEIWSALPSPTRDALATYATGFWRILPRLVLAVIFIVLAWAAIAAVNWILPRALGRAHVRRALIDVVQMLFTTTAWLFTALITITILFPSVTPANAIAALGLGSVAIGFAFKDVFENFLAGILLLIREPFEKGDFIECEGIEGQVEEITIRDTHVRQTDGQLVVAPNAMFFKNPVTIRTAKGVRRTTIICGVAYGEDVDHAREVIEKAVRAVNDVRDDVQDVQIFAQEFADSSINFEVTWWTGSRPIDIRRSRDHVVSAVKRALDDAGIEIPFPYRTLTFKEPLKTEALQAAAQREAAE
ncbi:MAG: mechanosensitive ion channel family protein [Shimia sp.]